MSSKWGRAGQLGLQQASWTPQDDRNVLRGSLLWNDDERPLQRVSRGVTRDCWDFLAVRPVRTPSGHATIMCGLTVVARSGVKQQFAFGGRRNERRVRDLAKKPSDHLNPLRQT